MARGSIQPHSAGKWRLFVHIGTDPVTGKRRQATKVVGPCSRRDAERALTALLAEVDGGHHAGPGMTFGELLETFLDHKTAQQLAESTLKMWRDSSGYVTDRYRTMPIGKIGVAELEALYDHLIVRGRKRVPKTGRHAGATGLSPAAVRNVHVTIYGAFELARRRKWVVVNPAVDAEVPRVPKRTPTPADARRIHALLAAADDVFPLLLPVFIRASICAGTRRGEMHGLRWTGVNWDRAQITIRDTVPRAGIVKPYPKDEDPRTVYLDTTTMGMLRSVYDQAFETAMVCGTVLADAAFVFTSEPAGGKPWNPQTTARRFTRACVAAGLPESTRIHDLRALCGTHLADEGVPIPVIGARLGHSLNSTTADIYVGRIPDSDRLAADVMGRLLDGDRTDR